MKPFVKLLSIAAAVFTLTACETVEGIKQDISDIDFSKFTTAASISGDPDAKFLNNANCPTIKIVPDLSRLHEFNTGQSMQSKNLVSSARMTETNSTCTFNERSVTVDLKLEFDGRLGPKGRHSATEKPFFSYPFFVAVTNSSGKILAKEIFAASMTYDRGQNDQLYYETLRQIIPADSPSQAASYKVMIGFQLGQEQLEYNRKLIAAEKQAEELAAKQLERERIAAEKAAQEKAAKEKAAQEATAEAAKETAAAETTKPATPIVIAPTANPTTNDGEEITVPKATRAGPFDIFKTDKQ